MPHRERYLLVCTNRRDPGNPKGSCAAKDSEAVVTALKKALVDRGLHKRLRACATGCLDLCELGAAMIQEPDHVAYRDVTVADVEARCGARASRVAARRGAGCSSSQSSYSSTTTVTRTCQSR